MIDFLFILTIIVSIIAVIFSGYTIYKARESDYNEMKERMVQRKKNRKNISRFNTLKKEYIIISYYPQSKSKVIKSDDNLPYKILWKNNKLIIKNLPKTAEARDSKSLPIKIAEINE